MYLNITPNTSAGLANSAYEKRSADLRNTPISQSSAAQFSERLLDWDAKVKAESQKRPDASETADSLDTDLPDDNVDGGAAVQLEPSRHSPHNLSQDVMDGSIAVAGNAGNAGNSTNSANSANAIGNTADSPAIPNTSVHEAIDSRTATATITTTTTIIGNAQRSVAEAPIGADSDKTIINEGPGIAAYATEAPQINTGPAATRTQTQLSGDMQALLSEFENSINYFERAGNSWVGSARITFQSSVLQGASVQITGDSKSLHILLTQSGLAPMAGALHRQEQQLSDALTRKLGRTVTLQVATASEIQAADDVESE